MESVALKGLSTVLYMAKIWVFDWHLLILRQNFSKDFAFVLLLPRKNLPAFCNVIAQYQSGSMFQICCSGFWSCTLYPAFNGANQLILVLPL